MKTKLVSALFFTFFIVCSVNAQEAEIEMDSIFVRIDNTKRDIINDLEQGSRKGKVNIQQSRAISEALNNHASSNYSNQKISGWRICIYRDNKQHSRLISSQTRSYFVQNYPNIPVYREYKNPYFYVYVGDFRTKDDAEKFKREIITQFPKAWLKKEEKINLPHL